ncbi:putative fad-binding domain-containing protein [Rosellinia necatrix]|uniref:Putative fad-binding domain-containing protein n=1 Tax=Rosellinia necatrix TaxID=77044 RepID=A0A1W2TBS7_ROSNE|nr:putative fad-binding domain-containing protein [Rosellinia necatrix]
MGFSKDAQLVIIVGAGIVGLALAQALKKENIPFQLYERDQGLDHLAAGWGISINWALEALEKCLPSELFTRVDDVQVDPEQGRQDTGRFLFLDLETLEPLYVIPPSPRKRVSRLGFRKLLAEGLDIRWGKALSSFAPSADGNGIVVQFADGTSAHGAMLIAADGGRSRTRALLLGEAGALQPLPVRFIGVTATLDEEEMAPLRAIDPLLFKGTHPRTNHFLWFSVLSTPETNGTAGSARPHYEAQINLSWPAAAGPEGEVPRTDPERLARMRGAARGFHEVLRRAIERVPDGTVVREIKIADWPPVEWQAGGLVTMLGDAAHPMTMYRGEAANHGLLDASKLTEELKLWHGGSKTRAQALEDFETEMRQRTRQAVLLSRQACLDAHDVANLGPESPLVSKRARVMDPGLKA